MFRHERPQKGRLRQFHQIGVEAFGLEGPDIDTELLLMTARLWQELKIDHALTLQINSLGTSESRAVYREALVDYLKQRQHDLDEDSQRRLGSNPLRILDSKNPQTQSVLDKAPVLADFLDSDSKQHFQQLCDFLDRAGIGYEINPRLVRGLDYYSKTVFEWVTDSLGAQGTVCAGGRYDGLVELLGGKPCAGIGFAIGLERLIMLLDELGTVPDSVAQQVDVYLVAAGNVVAPAMQLAEQLRDSSTALKIEVHCGGGSFKSQMKKADKSGANLAVILGEDERSTGTVGVKFLREERPQESVKEQDLVEFLSAYFEH